MCCPSTWVDCDQNNFRTKPLYRTRNVPEIDDQAPQRLACFFVDALNQIWSPCYPQHWSKAQRCQCVVLQRVMDQLINTLLAHQLQLCCHLRQMTLG